MYLFPFLPYMRIRYILTIITMASCIAIGCSEQDSTGHSQQYLAPSNDAGLKMSLQGVWIREFYYEGEGIRSRTHTNTIVIKGDRYIEQSTVNPSRLLMDSRYELRGNELWIEESGDNRRGGYMVYGCSVDGDQLVLSVGDKSYIYRRRTSDPLP